jgi:hypothetical protein
VQGVDRLPVVGREAARRILHEDTELELGVQKTDLNEDAGLVPVYVLGVKTAGAHTDNTHEVSMRAGRLYSEHVYWDQASVLVQVGLLDPKLLPEDATSSFAPNNRQSIDTLHSIWQQLGVQKTDLNEDRARARRSMNQSSRASQAGEEPGLDLKSDVEQSLPLASLRRARALIHASPRARTRSTDHLVMVVFLFKLRVLYSEHVYWDQASVLVQVGLLDPKLLPDGVQGVDSLVCRRDTR